MSCLTNRGITLPCGYKVAGLSRLYISNASEIIGFTDSDSDNILDEVEFSGSNGKFYVFEFADNSASAVEDMQFGALGNAYWLQTLIFSNYNTTSATIDVMEALGLSRIVAIVEYKSGDRKILFYDNAGKVTALSNNSGKAEGDEYGYTVTVTGVQISMMKAFSPTAIIPV